MIKSYLGMNNGICNIALKAEIIKVNIVDLIIWAPLQTHDPKNIKKWGNYFKKSCKKNTNDILL